MTLKTWLAKRLPPRRHLPGWLLAWATTFTAIFLAVGPHVGGAYDASLAILTLTVIAVIWYTYFTYRSVNRYVRTVVRPSVNGLLHPAAIELHPIVENRSPNAITARVRLEIWIDDTALDIDDFYSSESNIPIEPEGGFEGSLHYPMQRPKYNLKEGTTGPAAYEELRVRLTVFWKDETGETGVSGPRHYYARLSDAPQVAPVIAPERINKLFGALPAPGLTLKDGWRSVAKP